MNNVNANKEEIKYLSLDDIRKIWKGAKFYDFGSLKYPKNNPDIVFDMTINEARSRFLDLNIAQTMMYLERKMPADHSKFLLDFYNLFDENEPYKDKEGRPYRDKLLNDLYFNIYEWEFASSDGKEIKVLKDRTIEFLDDRIIKCLDDRITESFDDVKVKLLDNNQKIEKLKKSFDIFKRLKERDLVLASMYRAVKDSKKRGPLAGNVEYKDYLGNSDTNIILLNEKILAFYILDFFEKSNIDAFLFIRENFPNIKVTENMIAQYLEYKGR